MGAQHSDLKSPFDVFASWSDREARRLAERFHEREYDFALDERKVRKLLVALPKDLQRSVAQGVILRFSKKGKLVNALSWLAAVIILATAGLEGDAIVQVAASLFDMFDFEKTEDLNIDELIILLLSTAKAVYVILEKDLQPYERNMERLADEAFQYGRKQTHQRINKICFITWVRGRFQANAGQATVRDIYDRFDLQRSEPVRRGKGETTQPAAEQPLAKPTALEARAPSTSPASPQLAAGEDDTTDDRVRSNKLTAAAALSLQADHVPLAFDQPTLAPVSPDSAASYYSIASVENASEADHYASIAAGNQSSHLIESRAPAAAPSLAEQLKETGLEAVRSVIAEAAAIETQSLPPIESHVGTSVIGPLAFDRSTNQDASQPVISLPDISKVTSQSMHSATVEPDMVLLSRRASRPQPTYVTLADQAAAPRHYLDLSNDFDSCQAKSIEERRSSSSARERRPSSTHVTSLSSDSSVSAKARRKSSASAASAHSGVTRVVEEVKLNASTVEGQRTSVVTEGRRQSNTNVASFSQEPYSAAEAERQDSITSAASIPQDLTAASSEQRRLGNAARQALPLGLSVAEDERRESSVATQQETAGERQIWLSSSGATIVQDRSVDAFGESRRCSVNAPASAYGAVIAVEERSGPSWTSTTPLEDPSNSIPGQQRRPNGTAPPSKQDHSGPMLTERRRSSNATLHTTARSLLAGEKATRAGAFVQPSVAAHKQKDSSITFAPPPQDSAHCISSKQRASVTTSSQIQEVLAPVTTEEGKSSIADLYAPNEEARRSSRSESSPSQGAVMPTAEERRKSRVDDAVAQEQRAAAEQRTDLRTATQCLSQGSVNLSVEVQRSTRVGWLQESPVAVAKDPRKSSAAALSLPQDLGSRIRESSKSSFDAELLSPVPFINDAVLAEASSKAFRDPRFETQRLEVIAAADKFVQTALAQAVEEEVTRRWLAPPAAVSSAAEADKSVNHPASSHGPSSAGASIKLRKQNSLFTLPNSASCEIAGRRALSIGSVNLVLQVKESDAGQALSGRQSSVKTPEASAELNRSAEKMDAPAGEQGGRKRWSAQASAVPEKAVDLICPIASRDLITMTPDGSTQQSDSLVEMPIITEVGESAADAIISTVCEDVYQRSTDGAEATYIVARSADARIDVNPQDSGLRPPSGKGPQAIYEVQTRTGAADSGTSTVGREPSSAASADLSVAGYLDQASTGTTALSVPLSQALEVFADGQKPSDDSWLVEPKNIVRSQWSAENSAAPADVQGQIRRDLSPFSRKRHSKTPLDNQQQSTPHRPDTATQLITRELSIVTANAAIAAALHNHKKLAANLSIDRSTTQSDKILSSTAGGASQAPLLADDERRTAIQRQTFTFVEKIFGKAIKTFIAARAPQEASGCLSPLPSPAHMDLPLDPRYINSVSPVPSPADLNRPLDLYAVDYLHTGPSRLVVESDLASPARDLRQPTLVPLSEPPATESQLMMPRELQFPGASRRSSDLRRQSTLPTLQEENSSVSVAASPAAEAHLQQQNAVSRPHDSADLVGSDSEFHSLATSVSGVQVEAKGTVPVPHDASTESERQKYTLISLRDAVRKTSSRLIYDVFKMAYDNVSHKSSTPRAEKRSSTLLVPVDDISKQDEDELFGVFSPAVTISAKRRTSDPQSSRTTAAEAAASDSPEHASSAAESASPFTYERGDKVDVRFPNSKNLYRATILQVHEDDQSVDVVYAEGDKERRVPLKRLQQSSRALDTSGSGAPSDSEAEEGRQSKTASAVAAQIEPRPPSPPAAQFFLDEGDSYLEHAAQTPPYSPGKQASQQQGPQEILVSGVSSSVGTPETADKPSSIFQGLKESSRNREHASTAEAHMLMAFPTVLPETRTTLAEALATLIPTTVAAETETPVSLTPGGLLSDDVSVSQGGQNVLSYRASFPEIPQAVSLTQGLQETSEAQVTVTQPFSETSSTCDSLTQGSSVPSEGARPSSKSADFSGNDLPLEDLPTPVSSRGGRRASSRIRLSLKDAEGSTLTSPTGKAKAKLVPISSWQVGDKVEVRFPAGTTYYQASVTQKNNDGTYDVIYAEGDKERKVAFELMRSPVEPLQSEELTEHTDAQGRIQDPGVSSSPADGIARGKVGEEHGRQLSRDAAGKALEANPTVVVIGAGKAAQPATPVSNLTQKSTITAETAVPGPAEDLGNQ